VRKIKREVYERKVGEEEGNSKSRREVRRDIPSHLPGKIVA
jgi:hypothetical protein